MTNKEKFLINNVGFHFNELSLIKQAELQIVQQELGVSKNWILLALSKDSLESWEKWGFALFRKPEFKKNIDLLLETIDKMDDNRFQTENRKKQGKTAYVSPKVFREVWEGIKAQGRLYSEAEAAKLRLTSYWTYGAGVNPECYVEVDDMIKQEFVADEDQPLLVAAVQKVNTYYIK